MKNKLFLYIDLIVCTIWIINILGHRIGWNQYLIPLVFLLIFSRLSCTFSLFLNEKRSWLPLLSFGILWAMFLNVNFYNGMGDVPNYIYAITGCEHNDFADKIVMGSMITMVLGVPYIIYIIKLIRGSLSISDYTCMDLCLSVMWKNDIARNYCALLGVLVISFFTGMAMYTRLCMVVCLAAPALAFRIICHQPKCTTYSVITIIIASTIFWYAQTSSGTVRIGLLGISLSLVTYECAKIIFSNCRCMSIFRCVLISFIVGVIIPSFSIGYNQYTCISYPRCNLYYLNPYNGILMICDDTGTYYGLRDRYGLLVEPIYDKIAMASPTLNGRFIEYGLQKNGYTRVYSIITNEIYPSSINDELQRNIINIARNLVSTNSNYLDMCQIEISEAGTEKIISNVRMSMRNKPLLAYENSYFASTDSFIEVIGETSYTNICVRGTVKEKTASLYSELYHHAHLPQYKIKLTIIKESRVEDNTMKEEIEKIKEAIVNTYRIDL